MSNLDCQVESVLEELERIIEVINSQVKSDYNRGRIDAFRGAYGMLEHALTCRQVVMNTSRYEHIVNGEAA